MARPPAGDRPAGGERLWRIDINGGKITGYDVGGAAALADLARQLEADPDQRDAGRSPGGDRDPVAALAAAQLASDTSARTWAAFEAFVARPTQ